MTDIFCSTCDQAFEAYEVGGEPIRHAYGCSSELVGNEITIDMEIWQFVNTHPYHDGLICDNCISHLMRLGQIELVEGASGNAFP